MCNEWLITSSHYVNGTYMPCREAWGQVCDYCCPGGPRRVVQGHLCLWVPPVKEQQLLTVTSGALAAVPGLADRTDLAGRRITAGRKEGGRNAAMWLKVSDTRQIIWDTSKIVDPEEVRKVWHHICGIELVKEKEVDTDAEQQWEYPPPEGEPGQL